VDDADRMRATDQVPAMFDRIARRYDLLNRLLSFRRDVGWRRRLVRHLPQRPGQHVVDLATGTGDVLMALLKTRGRVHCAFGIDPAGRMLGLARDKLAARGLMDRVRLVQGDAVHLALRDNGCDAATMAFGIRNVPDVAATLGEIRRVLKPGGRILILEFSLPENEAVRAIYLLYLRHIVPRIGGLISGDAAAYRYLNDSVEEFPDGKDFCAALRDAGFERVRSTPLTLGIAALYEGRKPGHNGRHGSQG
jgi:demethylmenaquinone methyltransferase/2-methoxy-6-polyprenyl-1,4-benzoquinol methylase